MCVPRFTINYIVSFYFVCFSIAGVLMFTIPDKIGAKKTIVVFGTTHIIA